MELRDNLNLFPSDWTPPKYYVDLAILIDASGGMAPFREELKEKVIAFCTNFHEAMKNNNRIVGELRVKVIPFRDYAYDGERAMEDSGFFSLPEQNDAFCSYVNAITMEGGGDEPESALEALALAMRSDWTTHGTRRRHVIFLFTDAPAVPLKDPRRMESPYYPPNMPDDLDQLGQMWHGEAPELGGMPEARCARLVLYTPQDWPWYDLQVWNNVWVSFYNPDPVPKDTDFDMLFGMTWSS